MFYSKDEIHRERGEKESNIQVFCMPYLLLLARRDSESADGLPQREDKEDGAKPPNSASYAERIGGYRTDMNVDIAERLTSASGAGYCSGFMPIGIEPTR